MHRRKGPGGRGCHKTMFDRVMPTQPQMIMEILVIANVMFPKPPLPNATFPPHQMAGAQGAGGQSAREPRFDQPPPRAEIAIIRWHGPDAMHMIGQNHPSVDTKGPLKARARDRTAQSVNFVAKQGRSRLRQSDSEKDRRARRCISDVMCHGAILAGFG